MYRRTKGGSILRCGGVVVVVVVCILVWRMEVVEEGWYGCGFRKGRRCGGDRWGGGVGKWEGR